jgi:hypothetical protein
VRWVALFSDADHEVLPVTSGTRVTLVYSLSQSKRPRITGPDPRLGPARRAAAAMELAREPLMIACTRQVIAPVDTKSVQSIDVLRGLDREVADLLIESGFAVAVRSCILDAETDRGAFDGVWSIARLSKPIPLKVIRGIDDTVTFSDSASYDGEEIPDATCLGPFILDSLQRESWVIRRNAAATLLAKAEMFSTDGDFGNEGHEAHIYTLAALEVTPTN